MGELAALADRAGTILARLDRKLNDIVARVEIIGSRRKLLYDHVADAFRTCVAVKSLLDLRPKQPSISADSIEVLVRRVVEQAIVSQYVAKAENREVVVRVSKTSQHEFNKSFGESRMDHPEDLPLLPPYRAMAQDDSKLAEAFSQLSFTAHPRGAQSYNLQEQYLVTERGQTPEQFFSRRVAMALDHLELAVDRILNAFDHIDALAIHEANDEPSTPAPG